MVQPTADDFRALGRSSPWLWRTLRFRTLRAPFQAWKGHGEQLRAWVRRPGRLRVEDLDGNVLQAGTDRLLESAVLVADTSALGTREASSPIETGKPHFRPDGLVEWRPLDTPELDPFFGPPTWLGVLDPVELVGRGERTSEPPPTLVDRVRIVDHWGRRAWEADLRPTWTYRPDDPGSPLLISEVAAAQAAEMGEQDARDFDPEFVYPNAHRVRLDLGTAVCVRAERLGGPLQGLWHEMWIEAVDDPMPEELFTRPRRKWLRWR